MVQIESRFWTWNRELRFEYATAHNCVCAVGEGQGLYLGSGLNQLQNSELAGNSALEFGPVPGSVCLHLLQ